MWQILSNVRCPIICEVLFIVRTLKPYNLSFDHNLMFQGLRQPQKLILPLNNQKRTFWEYVNMMFNKPDQDRIKKFGPDRTCAEWVLRNGGKVVWAGGKKLSDYNSLPKEDQSVPKLIEIDATDSGISHYGFSHLIGCDMIQKIILHNAKYIDDRAMKGLAYAKESLIHVQVSKCADVTDAGLKELKELKKLNTLVLFQLASVDNLDECKQFLKTQLPKCQIQDAEINEKSQ